MDLYVDIDPVPLKALDAILVTADYRRISKSSIRRYKGAVSFRPHHIFVDVLLIRFIYSPKTVGSHHKLTVSCTKKSYDESQQIQLGMLLQSLN